MTTELRIRHQSQQMYVRALHSAYMNGVQIYDPVVWLARDPDAMSKMLRDADIAHAVGHRKHLVAGRQWTLQPNPDGDDQALDAMAVKVGTSLLRKIKNFTGARLNLAGAFLSGQRCARIHGETRVATIGDGKRRTWWFPVRLEDIDKRTYRIVAKNDSKEIRAHWEFFDLAKGDWRVETEREAIDIIRHTYQDDQASLGYGRGLIDALGWVWHSKTHIFQEMIAAAERFGQGLLVARVDGARDAQTNLPNEEVTRHWADKLENFRARHILVFDKSDEIEHIATNAEGYQLFEMLMGELRRMAITLILSASLPTTADKGGSYAMADVQGESTEGLIQTDREMLEESLTDGLMESVWWHNWPNLVELGLHENKPRFNIKQEKRLDPAQRATVAETAHNMGLDLAKDDLYEQLGFRQPQEDDDILEGADPMQTPGAMGDPGGGIGGMLGIDGGFGNLGGLGAMPRREAPPQVEPATAKEPAV